MERRETWLLYDHFSGTDRIFNVSFIAVVVYLFVCD